MCKVRVSSFLEPTWFINTLSYNNIDHLDFYHENLVVYNYMIEFDGPYTQKIACAD